MSKKIGKLAKRYARALLSAVEKEQGTKRAGAGSPTPGQKIAGELREFALLWSRAPGLSHSISSPMFNEKQREKALISVAQAAGLSEVSQRFLKLLFARDRIAALPEITEVYSAAADEAAAVIAVKIKTAGPINDEEQRELKATIEIHLEGSPVYSWEVDPELVGGIVVEYGGKVLDGSISGRLQRIERALL